MADLIIKQIKTSDNKVHEIDAKYWGGYTTSDLKTINGKPLLPFNDEDKETNITITAADLGLSAVLKYCGVTTTEISDGSKTNPVVIGGVNHTATAGCVVFYDDRAFVFNGTSWELLGDDITGLTKDISELSEKIENCVKNVASEENDIEINSQGGTITLNTYHESSDGDDDEFERSARISMNGSIIDISLEFVDVVDDYKKLNTLTLDQEGLMFNGSPLITSNDIDNYNILKCDENGIVNKNELAIGSFEIKNDKSYNYTFIGRYSDGAGSCNITAEYDRQGVIEHDSGGYFYVFNVTDVENQGENVYIEVGNKILVHAGILDSDYGDANINTINFVNDESENVSWYFEDNYYDGIFRRSIPFSLKHTSKALLNGVPVATVDMIPDAVKVDSTLSTTSVNPVQNKVITNAIANSVHFAGFINSQNVPELNEVDYKSAYGEWEDFHGEFNSKLFKEGDIIVLVYNEDGYYSEPTKEYILVNDNDGLKWVEFGKEQEQKLNLYRLEYTSSESLENIQPCNITYAFHEYNVETGKGVFIYDTPPTSIGNSAFYGCSSLTSVTIGNSVTSIGNSAFYGCESLTSVTIPDSVTSVGEWAFNYCYSLKSITIPNSVTSIGDSAFAYCTSLTSITIPNSVTSIGSSAFAGCTSLTSVTIPDSVTSIDVGAFTYCTSLTSITIPDSVTSIGEYAFSYCTSLTSATIGNSITSIGEGAFEGCNVTSFYIRGENVPYISDGLFYDGNVSKIYVPINSLDAYKSATNWSNYADNITGSEILSLSDDSLMGVSISLEERIKHLENIIEQIIITK